MSKADEDHQAAFQAKYGKGGTHSGPARDPVNMLQGEIAAIRAENARLREACEAVRACKTEHDEATGMTRLLVPFETLVAFCDALRGRDA